MPSVSAKAAWQPLAGLPGKSGINPTFAVVDPTRHPSWEEAVSTLPISGRSAFFLSSAWARVLSGSYGYVPLYLLAAREQRVCGCLPLMEVDSWLTGRRGVSLPFTDECSPLATTLADEALLLERAVELGRERNWRLFESQGGGNSLPQPEDSSLWYHGHALNLQKSLPELFASFNSSVRRAIHKAQREGLQGERAASIEALRTYYSLHCQTRRRHGLPPQPWLFFEQLHQNVIAQGRGFVVLARHGQRAVAGAVFVHDGREAIYKYAASDLACQNLRPSNLVLWEAIQWLAQNGFARLALGRTSAGNAGLRQFKQGWGSTEYRVDYLKFDYRLNRFVRGDDEAYGWHNAVFRRVPSLVGRMAGALLYRHWG